MPSQTDTYIENALAWATARLGAMGYANRCLAFIEDAFERSNGIELEGYASAKEAADGYAARDDSGIPPRGTVAFYDWWGTINGIFRNWGHVGLSLGDGRVIHALSEVRQDDYRVVPNLLPAHEGTPPRYIGWAPTSAILEGMKPRKWDV